jgi:nucleoside-diphosphate-sugar epimerase
MKVLVTGANGFVGRAVCRRLAAEGWPVAGALRRQTALEEGTEARRIGEIGPDTNWDAALAGVEAVVHLAARVHVMHDKAADPLAAFRRVNTQGTLRLAEAAAQAGVRHFVFMSSIKVNGEETAPGHPFRPDDVVAPEDPYGRSKWEAEQGLVKISAHTGMAVTILRPPLIYGPGAGGNLRTLITVLGKGLPLPLGLVDNRRSLLGVENLADAVACCLKAEPQGCGTYLLRDGEDVSTSGLIRTLSEGLGKQPWLLPVPLALLRLAGGLLGKKPAIDRLLGSLQVDDSDFRSRFGWASPITLRDGLLGMAEWFSHRSG